jgi:hypothetical protein
MAIQTKISFANLREKRLAEKLAEKAGLNLSNYIRSLLGLSPLNRGGPRPNAGRPKQEPETPKPE